MTKRTKLAGNTAPAPRTAGPRGAAPASTAALITELRNPSKATRAVVYAGVQAALPVILNASDQGGMLEMRMRAARLAHGAIDPGIAQIIDAIGQRARALRRLYGDANDAMQTLATAYDELATLEAQLTAALESAGYTTP